MASSKHLESAVSLAAGSSAQTGMLGRMQRLVIRISVIGLCILTVILDLPAEESPIDTGPHVMPTRDRLNLQVDGLAVQRKNLSAEIEAAKSDVPEPHTNQYDYPRLLEQMESQLLDLERNRAARFLNLKDSSANKLPDRGLSPW